MGILNNMFGATCQKCGEYLPPSDFNDNNDYIGDHDCT